MVNKEEEKNIVTSQSGNYGTTRDDEINLYDVWEVIVKRKKIIVALFLISLLGAAIYCFVTPKIYRLETYIKIHTPPGITTVYTIPMAKELSTRLSKIMKELKINNELNTVIFNHNPSDVTDVKIEEVIGTAGAMLSDSLKVTIEAKNREALEAAPRLLVNYIENINEHKVITSKIMSELNEKMALVRKADNENDIQLKEIQKRVNKATVLPVGFDPVTIRQNSINLKMEKYRLEHEIKNYKMILLLEEPFISKNPVKPKKIIIITLSGIISLIFGVFIVFIIEYFEGMRKI
jgi:capsular polysaccharide biosynthesis protein